MGLKGVQGWFCWATKGREFALHWPLGLALIEDALALVESWNEVQPGDRTLPAQAGWFLEQARSRVELKTGRALPETRVLQMAPFHFSTHRCVGDFISETLREGPIADKRGVDFASMAPLSPGDKDDPWVTVTRPGAWKDARIERVFNERFSPGLWRSGYTWGAHTVDVRSGIELYEDGYLYALRKAPELVEWIVGFEEVFDTAESNVASYCDYSVQEVEGAGQHWQDIAIRRSLIRLGRWFEGTGRLEIRGQNSEGYKLNPGQLDFDRPERIAKPAQYAWWRPGSIEDFSVSNFAVQTKLSTLLSWLSKRPIDEASLQSILMAQHPGLLPFMRSAKGPRAGLFVARTLSLMRAGLGKGVGTGMDATELDESHPAQPFLILLDGLDAPGLQTVDRLISEDALTRREALPALLALGEPPRRTLLEAILEDPAKKMRHRAREALG